MCSGGGSRGDCDQYYDFFWPIGPLGVRKRGVTRLPVRYGTGPGWSWSAGTGSSAGLDRRGSEARSEAGSLEPPSLSRNLRLAMHSTKSILVTGAYNLRP